MRLAAVIFEDHDQRLLSACALHKPAMDEWAWAERMVGGNVSEGVTYGDCPIPADQHEEYTDNEDPVTERSIRSDV